MNTISKLLVVLEFEHHMRSLLNMYMILEDYIYYELVTALLLLNPFLIQKKCIIPLRHS